MANPASRVVNLSKVKQSAPSRAPPIEPTRIAWAGGKITSNKDEAMLQFLRRKQQRGEKFTREQQELLRRMTAEGLGGHRATVQTGTGDNTEVTTAHQVYNEGKDNGDSAPAELLEMLEGRVACAKGRGRGGAGRNRGGKGRGGGVVQPNRGRKQQQIGTTVMFKEGKSGAGGKGRFNGAAKNAKKPVEGKRKGAIRNTGGNGKGQGALGLDAKLGLSLDSLMAKGVC